MGCNSKRSLKWSGGGGRSLRNLSKNTLQLGVGNGKVVLKGGGSRESVTTLPKKKM